MKTIKQLLAMIGKFALCFASYLIVYIVISMIIPDEAGKLLTAEQKQQAAGALLIFAFVNTAVLFYLLYNSNKKVKTLLPIVIICIFGLQYVMSQIETIIFIKAFPQISLRSIFFNCLGSFVHLGIIIPLFVWIIRGKHYRSDSKENKLNTILTGWYWKIPLTAVIYCILYWSAGFLIAWRFPETREFYAQWSTQFQFGILLVIQFLRGIGWQLFIIPIIWIVPLAGRKKIWLLLSALLVVLTCSLLIFPNPFMPETVRLSHFIEIAVSHWLFAGVLVLIYCRKKELTDSVTCV